ncbi:MAG: aldo/keto reductase [Acidobacteriaceae bacterium]
MENIELATTGRKTTPLGFGGSSIMGGLNRKESLVMLEAAFDAGIRHFDTAPMYGYGAAEACLGEFLKRHAGQATVTTKYGIPPAKNQSLIGAARKVAKPILRLLPGMKQKMAGIAAAATRTTEKAAFSPDEARASLETSLRNLNTDRIDVWLLHEAEAGDLSNPELLRFLEESVARGVIGIFGIGSGTAKIASLCRDRRPYCRVVQTEWSPFGEGTPCPGSFLIYHGALAKFSALQRAFSTNPNLTRKWSDEVDLDLFSPQHLAALLLKASLVSNPDGMSLFSSKNARNIQANIAAAGDHALIPKAERFQSLLRLEGRQLLAQEAKEGR